MLGKELGYEVPAGQMQLMQITRKRFKKITAFDTLEGKVLDNVEKIKYLCTAITNDFKWSTHISNICTKAIGLCFLRRYYAACPQDVKDSAYKAVVRPVLYYGSSVWAPKAYFFKLNLRRISKGQLDS